MRHRSKIRDHASDFGRGKCSARSQFLLDRDWQWLSVKFNWLPIAPRHRFASESGFVGFFRCRFALFAFGGGARPVLRAALTASSIVRGYKDSFPFLGFDPFVFLLCCFCVMAQRFRLMEVASAFTMAWHVGWHVGRSDAAKGAP